MATGAPPRVGIRRFITRTSTYDAQNKAIFDALGSEGRELKTDNEFTLDPNERYLIRRQIVVPKVDWNGPVVDETANDSDTYAQWTYAGKFVSKEYKTSTYPFFTFENERFQVTVSQDQPVAYAIPSDMSVVPCEDHMFQGKCTSTPNTLTYNPESFEIFFPSNVRRGGRTRRCRRRRRKVRTRRR